LDRQKLVLAVDGASDRWNARAYFFPSDRLKHKQKEVVGVNDTVKTKNVYNIQSALKKYRDDNER
jgi:hypothetical protein